MNNNEMLQYTDERIVNTIKQSNNFSEEQVEMAIDIAKERDLLSDEEIKTFQKAQEIEAGERNVQYEINEDKLQHYLTELKHEENFTGAIIAGIISAIVSAALWAVITVATNYQIAYMAIAVGIIVGFAIRILGKGISQKFGILGAIFALAGCVLGNIFSIIGFAAQEAGVGFFAMLSQVDFATIPSVLSAWFSPMDLVFYGAALYMGYNFSFRKISEEEIIENAAVETTATEQVS